MCTTTVLPKDTGFIHSAKKNSYLEREHFERGKHTVIISGKAVKIYDGNHMGDINCHSCSNMRSITW